MPPSAFTAREDGLKAVGTSWYHRFLGRAFFLPRRLCLAALLLGGEDDGEEISEDAVGIALEP